MSKSRIFKDRIKVKRDRVYHESAGGYVFSEENNNLYVALIKNNEGKYFIPKGHLKTNESPEQAASREVVEELHLDSPPLKIAKIGTVEYSFTKSNDSKNHIKKVHIYVFKLPGKLIIRPVKEEDYIEASWFKAEQAMSMLEYEKETLREAIKIYQGYMQLIKSFRIIINDLKKGLGINLVALIDSGSISSGGYKPGWSDIDILIVANILDLNSKLKIAEILNKLRKKLEIDIGLNVISEKDFTLPHFPTVRLAGKTLQALVEYSRQPERLMYSSKNLKPFVPNNRQIREYSISNIGYFLHLNRRELTNIDVADKAKFKALVGKQIRYAFIMMKLALQYEKNTIYSTKQDTVSAARSHFKDYDFDPIEEALIKTKNWTPITNQRVLKYVLKSANDFIENFSTYMFSKIR